MDFKNLNKSNTNTREWCTLAQIEDDEVKFFRVHQRTFSENLLTLTRDIENAVYYRSEFDAYDAVDYFKKEIETDNYYTLSDRVDLNELFPICVKETSTTEYEFSGVKQ